MDIFTRSKRRAIMSEVSGVNTSPEIAVRKALFASGFRFRLNDKRFPGKPDIMLPKYRAVIFVHGCFWHQHKGCPRSRRPETRKEFWDAKLAGNIERDKRNIQQLEAMGWRVAVIWECAIKKKSAFEDTMSSLINWIHSGRRELIIPK